MTVPPTFLSYICRQDFSIHVMKFCRAGTKMKFALIYLGDPLASRTCGKYFIILIKRHIHASIMAFIMNFFKGEI